MSQVAVHWNRMMIGVVATVVIGGLVLLRHLARTPPPARSWADGVYLSDCCGPLRLHDGTLTAAARSAPYQLTVGKSGYELSIPSGIAVRHGEVVFEGSQTRIPFNGDSRFKPALDAARAFHIYSDDGLDNIFIKQ